MPPLTELKFYTKGRNPKDVLLRGREVNVKNSWKEAESVYAEDRRADDLELQGGRVGMLQIQSPDVIPLWLRLASWRGIPGLPWCQT